MRSRLALAALLLTAGCTTAGPDFRVPDRAVVRDPDAAAPFLSARNPAFDQAPVPDHWWRLYDDAALNDLVAGALARNADLRVAEANLEQAGALVREAEAGRAISTTVGGGATLDRPNGTGGSLPGTIGYDIGISAAYPLDLSGRIARGIEAAQANAEAAVAARDYVRVAVAAATTRAYLGVCSANARLAALDRILKLQRETLDVTRRLQRGGRGTAFDVTRAQGEVDATLAQRPAIEADRQAALFALAALLGRPARDYPAGVASCAAAPQPSAPLPVGDGASLVRRRPDIREGERRAAAASAAIGVEMAQLYPQVSLGGSAGFAGPVSGLGSGSDFRFSLGPLISWSFPNRPVVRARIDAARAAQRAALAQFDATVLGALQETETNLTRYARERERLADLTRARDTAARAAAQAGKLYHFGRADFLQLLDAQRSLAQAESALATSRAQMLDRQVDVFLSLGGGWE
ncbi:TolC family protein [Stakelama saccharophila]|uniref:TolC family protein n=1 Tax=Stakelama saccharophila TaxID=3075605 RepID=A0ABZ0BF40_9SPHN|nr:TolC family protein [Stakelama sp. W311]WNO55089.1 TolC family protein [Stakelama sp. W311]